MFDRFWHAGLWQVLKNFNIEEGLVQAIQELYENSSSAGVLSLEQSFTGVLQENGWCPSGVLTLTRPVQLVPRADHAGSTPWPPHIHLH